MAYSKKRKEGFLSQLILLSGKYLVKQSEVAKNINTTRQHVSYVFNGKLVFSAEQFKVVCKIFHKKGASSDELALLERLFVEVKSNIDLQDINLNVPGTPIKQIIAENLDYLSPSELILIHKEIEICKFNYLRETNGKLAQI